MKILRAAWLIPFMASIDASAAEGIAIEYVAHACFRIVSAASGRSVMIDPYESRWWLGYDFPGDPAPIDAVLVSHPHSDHDGGIAAGREPEWLVDATIIGVPGSFEVGDIRITGIRGKHADPYGKEFGQRNTIWLLEIAGLRIVHIGDNGPVTDAIVDAAGRVDILMLPIDSDYHILSHGEIEAYRERLSPSILIPMHYRHDDLEVDPGSPGDLGGIDGWLVREENVRHLGTHKFGIGRTALPEEQQIVVFEHAPELMAPDE